MRCKGCYEKNRQEGSLYLDQKDIIKFIFDDVDDKKPLNRFERRMIKSLERRKRNNIK